MMNYNMNSILTDWAFRVICMSLCFYFFFFFENAEPGGPAKEAGLCSGCCVCRCTTRPENLQQTLRQVTDLLKVLNVGDSMLESIYCMCQFFGGFFCHVD